MAESAERFRTGILSSFSRAANELEIKLDIDTSTEILKILFDTLEKRWTSVDCMIKEITQFAKIEETDKTSLINYVELLERAYVDLSKLKPFTFKSNF